MIDVLAFKKKIQDKSQINESKDIFRKPKSLNDILKTAEEDVLNVFKQECFLKNSSGKIYKGIKNLDKAIKEDLKDVDLSKYNVTYLTQFDEDGAIEISVDVLDKETKETIAESYVRIALNKKMAY